LRTLSPAERVAFVLHDMFGVPFDEIGKILDRSRDVSVVVQPRGLGLLAHQTGMVCPIGSDRFRDRTKVVPVERNVAQRHSNTARTRRPTPHVRHPVTATVTAQAMGQPDDMD
jgi:hypothetical protein